VSFFCIMTTIMLFFQGFPAYDELGLCRMYCCLFCCLHTKLHLCICTLVSFHGSLTRVWLSCLLLFRNYCMTPKAVLPFLAAECFKHALSMCPKAYAAELGSVLTLPTLVPHNLKPMHDVHPCCGSHKQCILACHVATAPDAQQHLAALLC